MNIDQNKLTSNELADVESHQRLTSRVVYQIIRKEGEKELARPTASLLWSGIAAGIGIGFSVVVQGLLHVYLPEFPSKVLIEKFGYCTGFLIVILARQQLFTENTITVVLPVVAEPTWHNITALANLWAIVLFANIIGTFIFALGLSSDLFFPPAAMDGFRTISLHLMENSPINHLCRGIVAGWLIATLVWLLPSAEGSEFWVIVMVTYILALASLSHVIAGSVEALFLLILGEVSLFKVVFAFFLPTLAGNMIGGTALFALISYAQVKEEI